ncbi:MAG: hypothetical protein R1F54_06655 [Candidatus Zeuxoniibacter abyssi]|nr:MAG: hypothetical protein R1F54_06655 [Candidatus Persebacteraceae bacterium AB1(2)]
MENTIGLVRDFIPKYDDLQRYSHQMIAQIQNNINSRSCIPGNPVLMYNLGDEIAS